MTMSLIEQAARRLEELRRAGVSGPENPALGNVVHLPTPGAAEAPTEPPAGPRPAVHAGPMIEIDFERLAARGFVTPAARRSQIADEFRLIKRPLIAHASGHAAAPIRNANLIMVTSALPGEGKTFTAINLALSIAMEVDRRVLLVDADVVRPSVPRVLGLPDLPGLLDVLDDPKATLPGVLARTNLERLTYLSSGRPRTHAEEALASDAMGKLLEELATRYEDRIVIFDSPPLLVTTESRALATRMGQIVFVVRAEQTPQAEVLRALATIESCPVKMTVLNEAQGVHQGVYGYGYGYANGE
jgi:exopolysaccharide/PEP-CTERM locus tyrosine autokinase